MLTLVLRSLGAEYGRLLDEVMRVGALVAPRDQLTREVRPLILRLENPARCIVSRSGFSRALMWMEIAQLLAGEYDHELLAMCSPQAAKLMNAYGAYGPRVKEQLLTVELELRRHPDSRRAVVYIARPDDLRLADELNMPCSVSLQFFNREALEMVVNMRSWDLVWGLSYDVPMFVAVQQTLARSLSLRLGSYTHVAGSAHIYERHFDLDVKSKDQELPFTGSRTVAQTQVDAARALAAARALLHGASTDTARALAPSHWMDAYSAWEDKRGSWKQDEREH